MTRYAEVEAWCLGALEAYGDPSVPVCQLFFRWRQDIFAGRDGQLSFAMDRQDVVLECGGHFPLLPLPVVVGEAEIADGELVRYGLQQVTAGVWAVTPSLNVVGLIHGFVVLYDVPDPAPWERLVVLL